MPETTPDSKVPMPKGVKNVLVINLIIIAIVGWSLFNMYTETGAEILIAFASWSLFGTLLLADIILLTKMRKAWGMLRALIWVIALLQALTTMVLTKDFLSLWGALAFFGSLVVVIYLIGLRGYLNSDSFKNWFGQ
ncbi:hypothetical protein [Kangiella sediminilitoris]|uniref:Uncharacterized protein n=1 Tax=Kangiella sediminilitoris TaxID=1144748 RepID=A0A1B3B9N2_9GAMM|nr:hypothetical protein [Kangiella sediminilitoris]AOE49490.1 hypothetical protein KS2013_766 [Kangiella sediminilitoris]